MRIFKPILILMLLTAAPAPGYSQVGKAVKSVTKQLFKKGAKESAETAGKKAAKGAAKKAGKEAAEQTAEKTARELGKEAAERVINLNASKALTRETAEGMARKGASRLEKAGIEKAMKVGLDRVAVKNANKTVSGLGRTMSTAGSATRKLGNTESVKALENASKSQLKEKGRAMAIRKTTIRASKSFSGEAALKVLDGAPAVKRKVLDLEKLLGPPMFARERLIVEKSGKETIVKFADTKSIIRIKGNTIYANSGSVSKVLPDGTRIVEGELNQFLNKPIADSKYVVDKYLTYYTDNLGKTKRIETDLSKVYQEMMNNGVEHSRIHKETREQLLKSFGDFPEGVDYGHIIRRELGGLNESINALPMKKEMQRSGSRWYKMETDLVKACTSGKSVKTTHTIEYLPNGKYSINIEAIIDGKVKKYPPFKDLI